MDYKMTANSIINEIRKLDLDLDQLSYQQGYRECNLIYDYLKSRSDTIALSKNERFYNIKRAVRKLIGWHTSQQISFNQEVLSLIGLLMDSLGTCQKSLKQLSYENLKLKSVLDINEQEQLKEKSEKNISDLKDSQLSVCLICRLSPLSTFGGISTSTKAIAQGLAERNVKVFVVFSGDSNQDFVEDNVHYSSVSAMPLDVPILERFPFCKWNLSVVFPVYRKVKELVNKYSIDLIETPLVGYDGLLCAEFLDIPVAVRLQTPSKIVRATHEEVENEDVLVYYQLEKRLIEKATRVIAISDHIVDTIREAYDIEFSDKCDKNYLGLDDTLIFYPHNSSEENRIIVLFIGRLERRKGIEVLFKAISSIVKKYNNVEFRLIGADSYDTKLKCTYREYFTRDFNRLCNNVVFLEEISDEDKEKELEMCDILVAPSLYESFGIIFLEAMRHKKPIVTCNIGGIPEVVDNGVTGILCEPNNVLELEDALVALIRDNKMRKDMGEKGYERFLNLFTHTKMVEGTLEIYNNMIKAT